MLTWWRCSCGLLPHSSGGVSSAPGLGGGAHCAHSADIAELVYAVYSIIRRHPIFLTDPAVQILFLLSSGSCW